MASPLDWEPDTAREKRRKNGRCGAMAVDKLMGSLINAANDAAEPNKQDLAYRLDPTRKSTAGSTIFNAWNQPHLAALGELRQGFSWIKFLNQGIFWS